jgi:hypothetical protein
MTQDPFSQPPADDIAIDDNLSPYAPPRRTVWPAVIGILSICLSGLALVGLPLGLLMEQINPAQRKLMESMPDWYRTVYPLTQVLTAVLYIPLLVAGISLLRRAPLGRTLHLVCAAVFIVWRLASIPLVLTLMAHIADGMNMPAHLKSMMQAAAIIGIPIGFIYPVFLLVWFTRRKIRDEVAGWRNGIPLP